MRTQVFPGKKNLAMPRKSDKVASITSMSASAPHVFGTVKAGKDGQSNFCTLVSTQMLARSAGLVLSICTLLGFLSSAGFAQTTLVFEGFEGIFPGSWSIGDSDPAGGLVYWKDVNSGFGTVLPHTGGWKGYCAGYTNGVPVTTAQYATNMLAFMTRSINFFGYTGANLSFWLNIPSIELCCDRFRVYMDATQLYVAGTPTAGWTLVTLPLNAYVGGGHTLRFEFYSDFSIVAEGAYLDDILVDGANQPITSSLQSLQNANYSGYVLDADTSNGRSNIQAQAVFTVENFTGTNTTYTNVLSYRLINTNGNTAHPIYDQGNTATNASFTYNITNVISLAAGTNATVTNTAFIRPAAWMSQFTQFYLECSMLTNGVLAQTLTTTPSPYYHFTNVVSGDLAYNVLLNFTGTSWSRTYAVQTIPGQNTFQVNASYEVRRWDDFNLGIGSANIPIIFNYTLSDSAGNTVPLVSSSQTFFDSVDSYFLFFIPYPTYLAVSHTLDIQPSGQLDSVNNTYYLTVTISHTNNPAIGQVLTANTQGTSTNELLHFNGNLFFGSVGTIFTNLTPTPPVNPPGGGVIPTSLTGASGYVTAKPDHIYGPSALGVNLNSAGTAFVTVGSVGLTDLTPPDYDSVAGVNFQRGPVMLNSGGATADITVTLPTGFGYRLNDTSSQVISAFVLFPSVPLDPSLLPTADLTYQPGPTVYAAEESKPVWIVTDRIIWHIASGKFDLPTFPVGAQYVQADEYSYLASVSNNLVDPPNMGTKRSNDKYWLSVSGVGSLPTVQPDSSSNAVLSTIFSFGPGGFLTHFPYDTLVQWSANGAMIVNNDLVTTGAGSALNGASSVGVVYKRDCPDCGGAGSPNGTPALTITNGAFSFTTDGGLVALGTMAPVDLQWGYIGSNVFDFAQTALQFGAAAFHSPGSFMRGDQNLLPAVQRPTTILYTGFQADNPSVAERPLSAGYSAGLADYAGMNFRCVADNLHSARSTIAGQTNINWKLDSRSKYYVRYAGVTGIHEAVPGSFPSSLVLWGYPFTFTSYGLSYRDNQNVDSVTDGAISLPGPAGFIQNFNNMDFTCLGAPKGGEVPAGEPYKLMVYWVADFKTLSMTFATKDGCSPSAGYLVLGIEGHASHVDKPLYGEIGFFSNGDQIPPSFNLPGVTSRLKLPNVILIDGPNKSTYTFTPVQDGYYNTFSNSPGVKPAGWMNIFGKLDVPFFEDLQLHLQTSCHTNGVQASNAPISLSGGWPRPGTTNEDFGWHDPSGRTPFETNLFDWNNLGWPADLTIDLYRNNSVAKYHPRAQRLWLGFIEFDYPLNWDTTLRSFKSWQEVEDKLLIVDIKHQIKYMDAKRAEIDFGAQYDGLPRISIANLAFNAINEATGVGDSIVKAATQPIEDVLSAGLDEMDQLLDTQMKRMMDGVLDKTVNPVIDDFYTTISNQFTGLADKHQFVLNVNSNALSFLVGTGAVTSITTVLQDMGDGLGQASNLIGQVRGYLRDATNAINSIIGTVGMATNGNLLGSNVVGLIAKTNATDRPVVPKLLNSLVGDLAPQFINAVIGPTVSNLLAEADPTLEQITDTLTQSRDAIRQVDSKLSEAGEFTTEMANILNNANTALSNVSFTVSLSVTQYFGQFDYNIDNPFQHVSADDIKKMIRQKVEDGFFASGPAAQIQTALRQRLYDVDAAMKQQIDSVFQQMNGMMRDLISQSLEQLDNSINKCLGDVSDVIGAGKLTGHALIDGDSLKELRIDGHFQFKVPDNMELDAFLLIKELSSDGSSSGCYPTNASFTEVTIGANKIPLSWLGTDAKANVEAKFTFDGHSIFPVNLAGQLELLGELDFEAFQLHDLAAALAFGKFENYLALKGGVKFDGYDFSGAIFFGKTCSLDPLILIDPAVAKVVGQPPFTGVYCYAQGWLPISELVLDIPASCVFDISAGVGAGAFFFTEGPTFGGKMFLGVSGELLCIVSIEGDITLIGVKHGGDLKFNGHGHFEAKIGPCPFCLDISKDVDVLYSPPASWSIQ
jgi:hypothetical protein